MIDIITKQLPNIAGVIVGNLFAEKFKLNKPNVCEREKERKIRDRTL